MGYIKMSAFKKVVRLYSDYMLVGHDKRGKNIQISFEDFWRQLDIESSGGAGTPIFFDGSQLPSQNNTGDPVVKGDWTFLTPGNTYSNIGGGADITPPIDRFSFGIFNGDTWEIADMGEIPVVSLDAEIKDGDLRGVTGDKIFNLISDPIGIEIIPPGDNIVDFLNPLNTADLTVWPNGYYKSDGTTHHVTNWGRHLMPIAKGRYRTNNYVAGDAYYVLFDKDMNFLESFGTRGNVSGTIEWTFTVNEPGYLGISQAKGSGPFRDPFYITALDEQTIVTNKTFVLSSEFKEKSRQEVIETLEETYSVGNTPTNTNFISELVGSDLSNRELWATGFLRDAGNVEAGASWYHTTKYYPLPKGRYSFQFYFSGNARALIYDLDRNIVSSLSRPSGNDNFTGNFLVTEDSLLRFSHREAETLNVGGIDNIFVRNRDVLYPTIITNENLKHYAPSDGSIRRIWRDMHRPRKKRPVLSIISDDLEAQNQEWFEPLLNDYGVKATFAVIGRRTVEADAGETTRWLGSDYIKHLYDNGHDIASHTWAHGRMNEMTLEEVEEDISKAKIFLERYTNTPIEMFVSPFGIRNANIDNIIAKYHKANFISGYGSMNNIPLDPFFLNRVSFDASEAAPELLWESRLKPALDEAILTGNWVCMAIHPQYVQYRLSSPLGADRRQELRDVIEYCLANGIEVTTANRAYNYFKNPIEIGVQRYNDQWYKLGMDGSETNIGYFEE